MMTILAVAALAVQERPVVIELRDGTRIEGALVSFDGRAYVVRVGGEERRFAAAEIRQITFPTEPARSRTGGGLLANGGFEQGRAGWDPAYPWTTPDPPQFDADGETVAEGAQSLRITFARAFGWGGLAQAVDLPAERPIALRFGGHVRVNLAAGGVTLAVNLVSENGQIEAFHEADYATGTADWTAREVRVNVPSWARRAFFRIGGHAEGIVWFDALAVEVIPAFDVRSAPAGENVLRDGGFELSVGTFVPHWMPVYPMMLPAYQQGQAQLPAWDIDESDAREGSHSARIASANQLGFNSFTQNVHRLPAARRVRAEGFVRTRDLAQGEGAALVILFVDEAGDQIDWRMGDLAAPADWTRVTLEAEVPAGTAFIVFRAGMSGAGTAWFDDLSLSGVE